MASGSNNRRKVHFEDNQSMSSSTSRMQYWRPTPFKGGFLDMGQYQVAEELPTGMRKFLGEEPAIMMPVPLNWNRTVNSEERYISDMYDTLPDFLKEEFDQPEKPKGVPCRFCGTEWAPSALVRHQMQCKKTLEEDTHNNGRQCDRGYLIRNWYSPNHPLKRMQRSKKLKECRYCNTIVPLTQISDHEDNCRSLLYGTSGSY